MKATFAIDSLSVRDGRIFGWGWFLSARAATSRLELRIEHPGGQLTRLACQITGGRADLAEAFPHLPHASNGGFLILGRLPSCADSAGVELHAWLADGSEERVAVPGFPHRFESPGGRAGRWAIIVQLLRSGQFLTLGKRLLAALARRYSAVRAVRRGSHAQRARQAGARSIVFDHAMGGGANHFREEKIAEMVAQGHEVLLVSPHLQSLSYEIAHCGGPGEQVARYPTLRACLDALGDCEQVVVNDLVSFDDPLQVLAWIAERKAQGARTRFYLHDYFPACPVWTLVGRHGRYCGIPEFAECARCLPDNPTAFLSLLPKRDVPGWRRHWGLFLAAADEIVAFSKASVAVLGRAFPELDVDRIPVRPHSLAYLPARRVQFCLDAPLAIAIVGHITHAKGARVVGRMAEMIARDGLPIRLHIFGSIEQLAPDAVVSIHGPYEAEQLPALLERNRIGVGLLPSICPETYSYVTAELMALDLPLAVFDLGAPAERVRNYALGAIIPEPTAEAALDTIQGLWRRLVDAPEAVTGQRPSR